MHTGFPSFFKFEKTDASPTAGVIVKKYMYICNETENE